MHPNDRQTIRGKVAYNEITVKTEHSTTNESASVIQRRARLTLSLTVKPYHLNDPFVFALAWVVCSSMGGGCLLRCLRILSSQEKGFVCLFVCLFEIICLSLIHI